ncbi:hypothetical protein L3Y34_011636 [Caenorhabditis briggsae]|nr:hypothetical protein L3Y34_011636 [Caenorhabditis briggsae]
MHNLSEEITDCLAGYITHQQNLNRLLKLAHRNNLLKTDYVVETRLSMDDPVLPNFLFTTPLPMTFAEERARDCMGYDLETNIIETFEQSGVQTPRAAATLSSFRRRLENLSLANYEAPRLEPEPDMFSSIEDTSRELPLGNSAPLQIRAAPQQGIIQDLPETIGNNIREEATAPTRATAPTNFPVQRMTFYELAPFAEQGECNRILAVCNYNIGPALNRLKEDHLVQLGLVSSRQEAIDALLDHSYDLGLAADSLLQ